MSRLTIRCLAALTIAAALGPFACYPLIALHDRYTYPPPGKMVATDSQHMLHIDCTGSGSPTVVLEAAMATSSLSWTVVQPEISRFTRVCSYDRAGLGWSDAGSLPRTARQRVEELHALLAKAGIEGPYVLVGHSYGGFLARLFASEYPKQVVGLVLIDSPQQDFSEFPAWKNHWKEMSKLFVVLKWEARLGIVRFAFWAFPGMAAPYVDKRLPQAEQIPLVSAPKVFSEYADEIDSLDQALNDVRSAGDLGNLPLIVVRHRLCDPETATFLLGKTNEDSAGLQRAETAWEEGQQKLAGLSRNSELLVADQSGHNIQLDQPKIVVDAVLRVVDAARNRAPLEKVPELRRSVRCGK